MAKNIAWFKDVDRGDLGEVGGKGGNLGELTQAGIPVPEGFIVTASAYFKFIKDNGIDAIIKKTLNDLDPEKTKTLNDASKIIRKAILGKEFGAMLEGDIFEAYAKLGSMVKHKDVLVAVRSSATAEDLPNASFAGQQDTFLNIKGEKALLHAVREAYASLFGPRAIYYRTINKFDHMKVGIAIPVQRMVQSQQSGILFTIEPVTNNQDVLVVDAVLGLGEAIVSGSVSPDHYVVEKATSKIVEKQIARQAWKIVFSGGKNIHKSLTEHEKTSQKITDAQVLELARMAKEIEAHYKFPQDTEWAIEDGKIYFVQSRPITTFKKSKPRSVPIEVHAGETTQTLTPGAVGEQILKGVPASVGVATGPVQIVSKIEQIESFKEGNILVAEMTNPSYVPAMRKAVAIVTDAGGQTSHAAIISREIGIPAIVGTGQATSKLTDGQVITVDGAKGLVYKGSIEKSALKADHIVESQTDASQPSGFVEELPVTGTKIYVNLAEPDEAATIARLPVDGVGLLRAEFMIAGVGKHPKALMEEGKGKEFVDILVDGMTTICNALKPRPVVYRATDFKTNEYRGLAGGDKYEPHEENPMIGYRGAMRYIKDPELFALELEAIKTAREKFGATNLHLMIPFVRTVGELKKIKEMLKIAGLEHDGKNFKLWIMVEVPSTVLLIDKFCEEGIDGVSIGSNDLTQLILGVDRDNSSLAETFDERDDAVSWALKRVVSVTRKYGVTCSICGNAASTYPEVVELLVRAGATSVSVTQDVVIQTRKLVASVERRILLDR